MSLTWNIIFIASITQGIFLSIMLGIQYLRSKALSQLLLSILILLFSHNLINNLVYWNKLFETYPQLLFTAAGSRFLFAPLFFGYCLMFIYGRLSQKFWLHLIPFTCIFLCYSPYMFQSGAEKLIDAYTIESSVPIWLRKFGSTLFWLLSVQLIAYPMYILRKVNRSLRGDRIGDTAGSTQLNWIKLFSYFFLLYGLLMLLYTSLTALGFKGDSKDYPISLVMCIAIYCISYFSILNPELLRGKKILEKIPSIKYAKSRLAEDYMERVAQNFDRVIADQRLFLDGNLKIDDVAELIDVPKHHISQMLNVKMKRSFNEYLNERRVIYAQRLLDNMSQDDTIKTIMYRSGFNNRTSFNNNFKKIVGMTASAYVKSKVRAHHV